MTPNQTTDRQLTPEQKLDLWMVEEKAALDLLERGPGAGLAHPEQLKGKAGIQILDAMMSGELPYAECAKSLGFYAIRASLGYALFQGNTVRSQLNPMGTIHGGWISSILDSALGCAILSALPKDTAYATVSLDVKYQKFLTLRTERVRAEAKVVGIKDREAFAEATLFGPDDSVFARASTTCRLAGISAKSRLH
jgi:uncharacterized protein (TIGR00369 family)